VDLYIHSLISLHGVVLNQLSTGTKLSLSNIVINYHEEGRSTLLQTACNRPSNTRYDVPEESNLIQFNSLII
jgi:hypothetical protein